MCASTRLFLINLFALFLESGYWRKLVSVTQRFSPVPDLPEGH